MAVRSVEGREAEALVASGGVRVLDVRSPEEYDGLGHIPGAILLPVELVAAAPAALAPDERPLLVCCQHGVRSRHAAALLDRAGLGEILELSGGLVRWQGPLDFGPGRIEAVSSWLLECADLLPHGGSALDVACGSGRHALVLAAAGFAVRAVDRDAARIEALSAVAQRLGLKLRAEVLDLEAGDADLGRASYELILVVRYLHRPLFPALTRALAPGGLLLYETFTVEQARRGRPKRPDFLLKAGELPALVAGLEVLRRREGEFDGGSLAGIAARKG